jgi:hypothetical protein
VARSSRMRQTRGPERGATLRPYWSQARIFAIAARRTFRSHNDMLELNGSNASARPPSAIGG